MRRFFLKQLFQSIKNGIKENKKLILMTVPFILGLFIYYLYYLNNSMSVKTWDESCYWLNTLNVSELNIFQAIKQVIRSINMDEYNLLPSFILQPIFLLTNRSYNSYVLSTFLTCVVPTLLSFAFFVSKCNKCVNAKTKLIPIALGIFAFTLFPQMHSPVIGGYLDIICLIFVFIAYTIISDYSFENLNIKKSIILGICILMIAWLRRYFIIWIVAFYISTFLIHLVYDIKQKQIKQYLTKMKNIIITRINELNSSIINCSFDVSKVFKE